MKTLQFRVATGTDPGNVRDDNEDSLLSSLPLVAVADGVGGHNAGEVASALAVDVLAEWKPRLVAGGAAGTDGLASALREAAIEANRRVYARAMGEAALSGMATTLTAAWIEGGTCTLAHVGDSRAYLFRAGRLEQITEDQTIVAKMVREGRLSKEEAYSHPWRNRILQAVGGAPDVVVDMLSIDLQVQDRLLLASDGLTDEVPDAVISAVLREEPDPEAAGRRLIDLAKQAGGRDNITLVIVDVTGEADAERANEQPSAATEPIAVPPPSETPHPSEVPSPSESPPPSETPPSFEARSSEALTLRGARGAAPRTDHRVVQLAHRPARASG